MANVNHSAIREFFRGAGSTIISVKFRKKDGTIRSITFNPKDRQEIVGTGNPTENPFIFRIRDMNIARQNGSGAWRSFDARNIISIKSRGKVYNFMDA